MNLIDVPLMYLAVLGGTLALVWVALRLSPAIRERVLKGEASRRHALDGARGILALTVVIHHGILSRGVPHERPPGLSLAENLTWNLIIQLGSVPVALFFMITAYLFCGRIIDRKGHIPTGAFFINRAMRIAPLYYFTIGILMVISLGDTGWHLTVPWSKFAHQAGRFLFFNFVPTYALNSMEHAFDVVGTVWTLKYEIVFYATIPVMAVLYRITKSALSLYAIPVALGCLVDPIYFLFLGGILATQVEHLAAERTWAWWQAAGVLGLVADIVCFGFSRGFTSCLLLAPLFVAIVQGRRWFSVLGLRPMRYLGEISYSVYLLHNPLLWVLVVWIIGTKEYHAMSDLQVVLLMLVMVPAVIILSTCTFLWIEHPTMHWISNRSKRGKSASEGRLQRSQ